VRKLSCELQQGQLDDVVIELANEFSEDEIGILTHELANALGRVRDSAQREFEFNRGVSHELRSPVQVAQSALELLELHNQKYDNQTGKYVQQLKRSLVEMNEITEAFLRLASDRKPEPGDVISVAELMNTVATVRATYPDLELVTNSSLDPDFSFPLPEKVGAVIVRNLLRNAISHGENKEVVLELTEDSISVINQVSPGTGGEQSFGMGLSIVQRICERFGCEFSVYQNQEHTYQASIFFKTKTFGEQAV